MDIQQCPLIKKGFLCVYAFMFNLYGKRGAFRHGPCGVCEDKDVKESK